VLAVLGCAGVAYAHDGNLLASFDGAIAVAPVANVAGTPNTDGTFPNVRQNVVRGVTPAGPWTIAGLKAKVYANGRVRVRGRGLVLAAGNSIGQTANQRVFATLICEAASPFTEHSTATAGVLLASNGDFVIDDTLDTTPYDCASPVLLIRASSNRTWFAAGIPAADDNDD